VLDLEPSLHAKLLNPLERLGHTIKKRDSNAVTQAVARTPDGLRAASDSRKGGRAAGY
jgi:gamma-glutamyltranspeptidase